MYRHTQWLDAAYNDIILSYPSSTPRDQLSLRLYSTSDAILKLYSLWGYKIVLSDMQTLLSPIIVPLFDDVEFREVYLPKDPEFLALRAWLDKSPERAEDARQMVASAALRRAHHPNWIANCP